MFEDHVMKGLTSIVMSVLMAISLVIGVSYGQDTAKQHLAKGLEYGAQGQFKEAEHEFQDALKVNPFYAGAKEGFGVIKDVNEEEINPRYFYAYIARGWAYSYGGDHDKAISDYNKAMEINPRNPISYMDRGVAYESKGNLEKACLDFKRACELGNRWYWGDWDRRRCLGK